VVLPATLPTSTSLAADPGLALWLGSDSSIYALRSSTRNAYSTDTAGETLLVSDATQFAPDRLVTASAFSFGSSGLTLTDGASAFLTDETFLDVSVSFVATGDPSLVLRDSASGAEFAFDEESGCLPLIGQATKVTLTVSSGLVSAGSGGSLSPCMSPFSASERLSVGFRGPPSGSATVTSVTVDRLDAEADASD
jgi:hypothetical protein